MRRVIYVSDFDRIFEPQHSPLDLFTDRCSESTIFADGLLRHLERMADGTAALGCPRQNVLVFYGVGGIGKTELSRRLRRWLVGELSEPGEWNLPPRLDQEVVTVGFDFHGSSAADAADIVLRLRGTVASRIRQFPAFDLGLAAWWASAYPGTAVPSIRGPAGFDVKGQITDTLNDILSEAGARFGLGPLTVRIGDQIVRAILSHHRYRKALGECQPLEAVVEEARRDPGPYVAATLAGLLSWDLERMHIADRPVLVAFADAVEWIQAGGRTQERLLNRIIHLTPGVLWVVTCRDRLEWDSAHLSAVLPATGKDVWPGLTLTATTEPRQHLVGDLSDTDVVRYLHMASGAGGNPVLGADVIASIRNGAHGLPLYLHMSLEMARTVPQGGLDPAGFGGSLPQLVIRVLENLAPEERDLVRTASLLPRFDPELIAQATGSLIGGARLFCLRSLVINDSHALFPFRLHDAIRSAVTGESAETIDAWAPEDRATRAASLADALNARHDGLRDSPGQRLDVLELVAYLCAAHDLRPTWVLGALLELPGMAQTAARLPPPDEYTWIGQVSRFFEGWRNRSTRERIDYLSRLLESPLPSDINEVARRWLGYAYNTVAEFDMALAYFQELLSGDPESNMYRYQVARNLHALARYDDIDRHLEQFPLKDDTMDARFRSDLAYDRGEIEAAIDGAAYRARRMLGVGNYRVALDNQQVSLWRAALVGRASVADCDTLIAQGDQHGRRLTMRMGLAAKVLCTLGDNAAVRDTFTEMTALTNGPANWLESFAGLINAIHSGGSQDIIRIRKEWDAKRRSWTPNRQAVDRIFVFAGYSSTYPNVRIGDAAETAKINQRWHAIIERLVNPVPRK